MAVALQGMVDAKPAGADLSDALFKFAKVDTDGRIVLAGSGEAVYGVITETNVEDRPVTVQMDGIAKVNAGAAITAGDRVQSDADGHAITLAGGRPAGIARTAVDEAGQIVEVALTGPGA